MYPATAVSFTRDINSLPRVGSMFLIACGIIIYLIVCILESPRDLPASAWPMSIDPSPALIISATYAAEFKPNASVPTNIMFISWKPAKYNII